jgi:hypothetical protein
VFEEEEVGVLFTVAVGVEVVAVEKIEDGVVIIALPTELAMIAAVVAIVAVSAVAAVVAVVAVLI